MAPTGFVVEGRLVPVYKVQIFKTLDSTVGTSNWWTNTYHVQTVGPEEALIAGESIGNAEAAFHADLVNFWKIRVTDPTHLQFPRTFFFEGVSGERVASGLILPQWNVVDVRLQPLSFARQDAKFYRVQLGEGDVDGAALGATLRSLVQDTWDALIDSVVPVVNPAGSTIITAAVSPLVGMRQVGWHRRTRPGFHRGYIPNA